MGSSADDSVNNAPTSIPDVGPIIVQTPQIPRPQMDQSRQQMNQMPPMPQFVPQQRTQQMPSSQFASQQFAQPQQFAPQQFASQPMQQFSQPSQFAPSQPQQFQRQQMNQPPDFAPLPPLDSMNNLPPLEGLDTQQMDSGMLPEQKKKKVSWDNRVNTNMIDLKRFFCTHVLICKGFKGTEFKRESSPKNGFI